VKIDENEVGLRAAGEWYRLEIARERPAWAVVRAEGRPLATLFVPSSVDTSAGGDMVGPPANWHGERADEDPDGDGCLLAADGRSSVWDRKRYTFECAHDWFAYGVEVEGRNDVQDMRFFEGFFEGSLDAYVLEPGDFLRQKPASRPVKDWLTGSMAAFEEVFVPDPVASFRQWVPPFERADISVTSSRDDLGGSWFFTPAPLCYCVRTGPRWVAIGVAADPGANNFLSFEYTASELFGFRLAYDGRTRVEGTWRSPKLVFVIADNEYEAVARYVAWLRERGYVAVPRREVPSWWRRPIICGWGEQCHLARLSSNRPSVYATQTVYERIVQIAREQRIPFGTLIIDDKWQAFYGLNRPDAGKWPDLRGFIDRMAAEDVRVVLWYNSWGAEGVPPDECITKNGEAVCVDPTNPAYERRLREQVRFMLSPDEGCLNAFGFKIDFTANAPTGSGLRVHQDGVWGVELLKRLFSIIYSAAKEAKGDALIITQTANPYFGDVTDMLRLNDICSDFRSVVPTMEHRANVARAACPEWLIDCDNYPLSHLPAWREYVERQPALGVPSLYYLTSLHAEGTEFGDADYDLLRRVYGEYANGLEASRS
jgi:hypothetical protein